MKIKFLLFLLLLLGSKPLFGQADTIRLVKNNQTIYRCTNTTALSWYLYKKGEIYYLVNLSVAEEDVEDWFQSYLNSQNLFCSKIYARDVQEFFHFQKPNNLEDRIIFEIIRRSNSEIVTQSAETGEEFCFKQIEF